TWTWTVWLFTDAASIRLLMVNVTGLVTDTLLVLFAGLIEVSLNDWEPYEAVPVVNVLVNGVTELPSISKNPLIEIVYVMEAVKAAAGVNVRVTPSLARVTVPAIALPAEGVTVIELFVIEVGSMVLFMTATICAFRGTPVPTVVWLVTALAPVTKVELKQ